ACDHPRGRAIDAARARAVGREPSAMRRRVAVACAVLAGAIYSCARSPDRNVVEIPFTSPHHQIVIDVMIEGRGPYRMMLDTGTDPSVVDAALARRLRAPSDTTLHEGEGAGREAIRACRWDLRALEVGALHVDSVVSVALDLSRVSQRLGTRVDGVLGYSLLAGRIVQVDFPRHRVRFYPELPPPTRPVHVE